MRGEDSHSVKQLFFARMQDLASAALRDGFAAGKFLTLEEQALLSSPGERKKLPGGAELCFLGGYENAERRLPLFYDPSFGYPREMLSSLAGIAAVEIRTASGAGLSHREILGSLMALGVERETVGDILPYGESPTGGGRSVFFTLETLVPYFQETLSRIGRESVQCAVITLPQDFKAERKTKEIRSTIASLRLDCLIAALLQTSREKAKALIEAGLVEKNHLPLTNPSAPFCTGDRISVRKKGRFDIVSAEDEDRTRKGRIRLAAAMYID